MSALRIILHAGPVDGLEVALPADTEEYRVYVRCEFNGSVRYESHFYQDTYKLDDENRCIFKHIKQTISNEPPC